MDETDTLRFAPPVRERKGEPTVADIAAMLDVPIEPPIFLNPDESDDEMITAANDVLQRARPPHRRWSPHVPRADSPHGRNNFDNAGAANSLFAAFGSGS
jgi:hypothetical protein